LRFGYTPATQSYRVAMNKFGLSIFERDFGGRVYLISPTEVYLFVKICKLYVGMAPFISFCFC
jgi:hypothetical protein